MVGVSIAGKHNTRLNNTWQGGIKRHSFRRRAIVGKWIFALGAIVFVALSFNDRSSYRISLPDSSETQTECRYDGNCPVGEICRHGSCTSYLKTGSLVVDKRKLDLCLESCLNELRADEWFYYGSVPVVEEGIQSVFGCVLKYRRVPKEEVNTTGQWTPPSYDEWLERRFLRVIRTDPKVSQSEEEVLMRHAVCGSPCESDEDCPDEGGHQQCLGRSESQIPAGNGSSPKTCRYSENSNFSNDMMIVSGADKKYYNALENFAASLRFWSPRSSLVVYNLGMSNEQIDNVEKWPNVHRIHWRDGFPESFPPHVKHALKNYAWKSLAINESVHEYKSIFWLDAGATFTAPIDSIQNIVHRDGIFVVKGQDSHMKVKSHPGTYQWFGYEKDSFVGGPHFAGGIQGHVYPSRFIDTIVIPNAECALNKSCISPEGSSLVNHRYDQTSLSILAYQNHVQPHHHTEYLAANRHRLNEDMTKTNNRHIMWTARGSCRFYSKMTHLLSAE
eukprot:scaffold26523_cov108-Cylindrotheca_fusiformis.AAC.2